MVHNVYVGSIHKCFVGYAKDEAVRDCVASGGIVTTILLHLLEEGKIDGALVTRLRIEDGNLKVECLIAKTPDKILESRTSIYIDSNINLSKILQFKGRLAVVGLPCHIRALNMLIAENPALRERIVLKIGLFCGHVSQKKLIAKVLEHKKIDLKSCRKIVFRKGHWRGHTSIELKSGKKILFPYNDFGTLQNLHFFTAKKCAICADYTAEKSDLSCGDVWSNEYQANPIKHNVIVCRNRKSAILIDKMIDYNLVIAKRISLKNLMRMHKRALIMRVRSFSARVKIFSLCSCTNIQGSEIKSKWNDYVTAYLFHMNARISENRIFARFMFLIPGLVYKLYFYALCILLTF